MKAIYSKINDYFCPYLKKEVRKKLKLYFRTYMIGLPNSLIYDEIDEAKGGYEIFLQNNKSSDYYGMIKNYYSDLKRNNFKFWKKEYKENGYPYMGCTIYDKEENKIFINDVVDKYIQQVKID